MSVVSIVITSQGREMDPSYGVLSLEVDKEVNRLPTAQLRIVDGDAAAAKFEISDAAFFAPGSEIEIKLGYVNESNATVFKGIVVRHGIDVQSESTKLIVDLKDKASKLTFGRKSAVFRDQTDDEIIKKILGDAGVTTGEVAQTQPKHAELVQYHASDWDFMLSRADVQGLVVAVDDGKVSVKPMKPNGANNYEIEYGIDAVFSVTLDVDGSDQHKGFESVGWDLQNLEPTEPSQAKAVSSSQGNIDGQNLAADVGAGTYKLAHIVPVTTDELQAWADARMTKTRMSMIRGLISIAGLADIKPLDVLKLKSFGKRFDGDALVTGVRHHVEGGAWRTEVRVGIDPEWYCHRPAIAEAPSAGLLPPVSGLQIGIVDEYEDDPDDEYRIKVKLPAIDADDGVVWARLATPEAGKDRGYFFRPEPGDEVVVGFFNSDPRAPVILGAMFGSKNEPHDLVKKLSDKNVKKAIITKKGTTIAFVDEDKASIFIETKDENRILLDDDKKLIELEDQHGNKITMNENGITIKCEKDLKIEVKGKLNVEAKQDVVLKSQVSTTINAPKVDIE
jgi:Rhs element Vgr protein